MSLAVTPRLPAGKPPTVGTTVTLNWLPRTRGVVLSVDARRRTAVVETAWGLDKIRWGEILRCP